MSYLHNAHACTHHTPSASMHFYFFCALLLVDFGAIARSRQNTLQYDKIYFKNHILAYLKNFFLSAEKKVSLFYRKKNKIWQHCKKCVCICGLHLFICASLTYERSYLCSKYLFIKRKKWQQLKLSAHKLLLFHSSKFIS